MLLSLKKKYKKTTKKTQKTTRKQTKTATACNSSYLHHRWRCCQSIALNDQQVGLIPCPTVTIVK